MCNSSDLMEIRLVLSKYLAGWSLIVAYRKTVSNGLVDLHFCALVNEFECISSSGLDQRAAQVSARDAQLTFVKVNHLQLRINCKNRLNITPSEGSFGTDDPFEDVVRVFAFRLVGVLKYTDYDPLGP